MSGTVKCSDSDRLTSSSLLLNPDPDPDSVDSVFAVDTSSFGCPSIHVGTIICLHWDVTLWVSICLHFSTVTKPSIWTRNAGPDVQRTSFWTQVISTVSAAQVFVFLENSFSVFRLHLSHEDYSERTLPDGRRLVLGWRFCWTSSGSELAES